MSAAWDLAVVGGGFAGLAAAEAAAARGMSVVVLERKRSALPLATTGLLCPDTVALLEPSAAVLRGRLDAFVVRGPSGAGTRIERTGAGFTVTDTPALLDVLAERARGAGAEVRHRAAVEGACEDSTGVTLALKGGERVRARYVIGADGARSSVGRSLRLARPRRMLLGLERHVEVRGEWEPGTVLTLLHRGWAPGYFAWAFPAGHGIFQVGVMGVPGAPWRPPEALDAFESWLARHAGMRLRAVREVRGGLVPASGALRAAWTRRCVLAGDAAGHVSALTAGGIGRAAMAARALAACIERGPVAWRSALQPARRASGLHRVLLRRLFELTRLPGGDEAAARAAGRGLLRRLVEELLFRRHRDRGRPLNPLAVPLSPDVPS